MTDSNLENKIAEKLKLLNPNQLDLKDNSHLHAGHKGMQEHGGRHYELTISSASFEGLNLIKCHQLVYQCLSELLKEDIHALKIKIIR